MANYPATGLPINEWAEADRPREKMLALGKHNLSDAELLAIILGSGSARQSAVSLAQQMLDDAKRNLDTLGKYGLAALQKYHGVGPAKAISIAAALELGRRRQLAMPVEKVKVTCSRDSYQYMAPLLMDLPHEEFWVAFLNRNNRINGRKRIGQGGTSGVVADAKLIFRAALENFATSIILFHNHPSGNRRPSEADILLTRKLRQAGRHLDILVLDHLIIADRDYYSFADAGALD